MLKCLAALLDLLNDYRDTVYYTLVVLGFAAALFFGVSLGRTVISAGDLLWLRECVRSVAWSLALVRGDDPNVIRKPGVIYYPVFCCTIYLAETTTADLADIVMHQQLLASYLSLLFSTCWYTYIFYKIASPKTIITVWWQNMFDYPRKQKPPHTTIKKLLSKLKSFIDKNQVTVGLLPSPAVGRSCMHLGLLAVLFLQLYFCM